ncbi:MAG: hypothetical protein HY721_16450 [Planctomycetes bacterium]|nr:hypothetical protein [Planctomycetota bacterium]
MLEPIRTRRAPSSTASGSSLSTETAGTKTSSALPVFRQRTTRRSFRGGVPSHGSAPQSTAAMALAPELPESTASRGGAPPAGKTQRAFKMAFLSGDPLEAATETSIHPSPLESRAPKESARGTLRPTRATGSTPALPSEPSTARSRIRRPGSACHPSQRPSRTAHEASPAARMR